MIKITSQSSSGQYDEEGNQITEWNPKLCEWVVLPKYKADYDNNNIDWWGKDNDFPAGATIEYFNTEYPNWESRPVISICMYFNPEGCKKAFPDENQSKYKNGFNYGRTWEYLDYSFKDALNVKSYLQADKFAEQIRIVWEGIEEGQQVKKEHLIINGVLQCN